MDNNYINFKYFFIIYLCLFGLLSKPALSQKKELKEPTVIKPGKPGQAPSDAIILFDKKNLDMFESIDGSKPNWEIKGKKFTVVPGEKNIHTKKSFGDCQLHIEWKTPVEDVKAGKKGPKNGNSGIYFMSKYEVQILNSYQNPCQPDRQASSIYLHHAPLVNASLKAGEWQTYDIVFIAPRFDSKGDKESPGYITVFHNGVVTQHNSIVTKPTTAHNKSISEVADKLPLMLQSHNNKVSYRNIWIREL